MKKTICLLLAVLLLLTGCQTSTAPGETTVSNETTAAPTETAVPETTLPKTAPDVTVGRQDGEQVWFQNPGKVRITYTSPRSSVRYITSVEELPSEEVFQGYDEAFFGEYALLIVVETVSSGSVQLEIGSVEVEGDTARVTLERTMSGDVGTTDMATWLLWAEVEQGLEYTWTLAGGAQSSAGEKY